MFKLLGKLALSWKEIHIIFFKFTKALILSLVLLTSDVLISPSVVTTRFWMLLPNLLKMTLGSVPPFESKFSRGCILTSWSQAIILFANFSQFVPDKIFEIIFFDFSLHHPKLRH